VSEWSVIACVVVFCSVLGASLFSAALFRTNLPADLLQPSIYAAYHLPEWYLFPLYMLLNILPSSVIALFLMLLCAIVCCLPLIHRMNTVLQRIYVVAAILLASAWVLASLYGVIVTAPFAYIGMTDEAQEVLIVSGIFTALSTASLLAFRRTFSHT
jgi:quinol-cytochrome oxidoreductase complex cytochrome b subunit